MRQITKRTLFLACFFLLTCSVGSFAETIKILAIGNSFSEDAVENYLYELGQTDNVTFIIGNMYIGGCSLETHATNAANNSAAYSYRKINSSGTKTTTENVTLETAITDEDWDYITFQQVSQNSGMYDTYFPYLTNLLTYVKGKATNPSVQYAMHMTWAYQQNSTHSGFVNYSNNQLQMYNAIIDAVPRVADNENISIIIPSGTTVQNARTSFVGDNLCRDGYHLDYLIGRYAAACTWYEKLTGNSVVGNAYIPAGLSSLKAQVAQTAAHNAVTTPFSITDLLTLVTLPDAATYELQSPVNIDFGTGSRLTDSPWNNISSVAQGTYAANMLDMNGNETPLKVEITSPFGNINQNGPNKELTLDGWTIPANANYDSFWGNAGAAFESKNIVTASLEVSSLNTSKTYDFKFFSSRSATDNREIYFKVIGATTDSVAMNGASNETICVSIKSIAPKADGTIEIIVGAGPNNNNTNKFFYLNAMQIAPGTIQNAVLDQKIFIDFGVATGAVTNPAGTNYWNNYSENNVSATALELVNSANVNTAYKLQTIKKFTANTNVGLASPSESLLGDLAVVNATKDFFFVEGSNTNITGAIRLKNLNPQKGYKFHIFGSREGTTENRTALFTFYGMNVSSGTNQASGSAIGDGSANNNNNSILISDYIFPDNNGEIVIEVSRQSGSYAYINAMKIEEYSNVKLPHYTLEQKFYFDFGHSAKETDNSTITNNYWNNINNNTNGSSFDLLNAAHSTTAYKLNITSTFAMNDTSPGGLSAPDADLQGADMAVETATVDYLFVEGAAGAKGGLKIKNLDTGKGYKFYLFGTRSTTDVRLTVYTFTGQNSSTGTYQTSGSNIGGTSVNGNTSSFFITDMIFPDSNGEILLEVTRENDASGQYAYLGAMRMEEYALTRKATAITVSGDDITLSGKTSQMTVTPTPVDVTLPAIEWSVDNENVAWIDATGVLHPVANGTVNVTATVRSGEDVLTNTKTIAISNQFSQLYLGGTGLENGDGQTNSILMKMLTDANNTSTGVFEVYTKFNSNGYFNFYSSQAAGEGLVFGISAGKIVQDGTAIAISEQAPVRITVDLANGTYSVLPLSLALTGSALPGGWSTSNVAELTYQGNGVWNERVTLNAGTSSDPARVVLLLDRSWNYQVRKVVGSDNSMMLASTASQYGYTLEDIGTNMNGGTYDITFDFRNGTYSIACTTTGDYKISVMGSSVANGQGADNMQGYAYMYAQLLQQRYSDNLSEYDWQRSNISINGNNTSNVLDRWNKDLLGDCSSYVIYGLSLGNEGIHDNGQTAFNSYKDNMLLLIDKARAAGITPVVCNNYTRTDFNATDYAYIKQMNLLMHEWDVPSINMLGAIDNGSGNWADGYQVSGDIYHPTTDGHREFFYVMVPSLFDALEAGKAQPALVTGTSYQLGKTVSDDCIEFTPENIVHPFTLSFDFQTGTAGTIASFENATGTGSIKIDDSGNLIYESPLTGSISYTTSVLTQSWHKVTLTHYYAQGRTVLYVNDTKAGEINEKLEPAKFRLSDSNAPDVIDFRQLFFWRAGMNGDEIAALNTGKMLKSSLEIYAPLDTNGDASANLAQSTNTIAVKNLATIISPVEKSEIRLYPNPASNKIMIFGLANECQYEYRICGLDGKTLQMDSLAENNNEINIESLTSAYYLLELTNPISSEKKQFKFIKLNN